jgi:hypothetical protein
MRPGRGILVASRTGADLTLEIEGTSRDITEPFVIHLECGWNAVGNPFSFGRYWNDATVSVLKDGKVLGITEAANQNWVDYNIWWTNKNGPTDDRGGEIWDVASSDPLIPNQAWEKDDGADDPNQKTQFPATLGPFAGFLLYAVTECDLLISPTSPGPDDIPPLPASPAIVASSESLPVLDVKPPQLPSKLSTIAAQKPKVSAVFQNYPNPFNPETWVPYQIAEDADVIIRIYDVKGHLIRVLDLGHKTAGFYVTKEEAAFWNGRNDTGEKIASGLYFYQLQAGKFQSPVTRMVILK